MKIIKLSAIIFLSLFFICAFSPQVHAKHCKSKSYSSFGLSFNFAPTPSYVSYVNPAPVVTYAPVAPVYSTPVYYSYPSQMIIARPPQPASVYIAPQFSYWHYR